MNKTVLQTLIALFFATAALAQNVAVTFRVDMTKVANLSIQGAFFAGTPNSWVPQAMSPVGNGKFELTLDLPLNADFEYRFLNGPGDFEPATNLGNCATNGNREVSTYFPTYSPTPVCFGECGACTVKLNVSVDMSSSGTSPGSYLIGRLESGYFTLDDMGAGIYSGDIVLPTNSSAKYAFGFSSTAEPTQDLAACGTATGTGGFWRTATIGTQDKVVPVACFGRCGSCQKPCATDPNAVICENFNSLSLGPVGPQVAYFSGVNGTDGGPEDPSVSAAQSSGGGGQSLKISGDNAGGATPNVTVLRLGNQAMGNFDLKWKMYFPYGKSAFFNIVSDEAGSGPLATVVVSPVGDVFLTGPNGQLIQKFSILTNSWRDLQLLADVSNHVAQLRIEDYSMNIAFSGPLGGINFTGIAPNTEYFVDEIEFRQNGDFKLNIDDCQSAFDLSPYLKGGSPVQSSMLFDNTGATAETGLAGTDCFTEDLFGGTDEVQNSLWYKFEGNGRTYQVQTAPCDAGAGYIDGGDTQMAAYTGEFCGDLIPLGCNDDIGFQYVGDFRSGLVIASEINKTYRLLVDGFDGSAGKFCLQFTQFQQVTFQVDATNIATVDPQGMFIQGSWDGFSAPHAMSLAANNVWQYTIDMPPGAVIEWKYQNGPGGWEPDAMLGACGTPNPFGGFNRVLTVSTDVVLPVVCFASCEPCATTGWYDECAFAENISAYFGKGIGVVSTTPTYDNTDATIGSDDPVDGWECFLEENGPELNRTTFFTFVGDGKFYEITTTECNSTNYITAGDTQMAIYEGDNCQFGASVACNDDLDIDTYMDFRSGVLFKTVAGQPYTILIDGWDAAKGEFCIQIVEVKEVGCAEAMLGEPESEVVEICFGETSTLFINGANTVVPNVGPIAGFTWIITQSPLPAGWVGNPFDYTDYFFGTGLSPTVYELPIQNDGQAPPGIYILTPVLVSGATPIVDAQDPLQVNGGCFVIGSPIAMTILPEYDPIAANGSVTPESAPGNNGSITLNVEGGSGAYEYLWSNGQTTQNLANIKAGQYTVTITDATGCVEEVKTFTVAFIISTGNLPGVSALSVLPNPTSGPLDFSIQMTENQPVSVRLVNALGQIVAIQKFAGGEKTDGSFDLSGQAAGVFFLRFEIGGRTVERKVVLVK